MTAPGWHLSLNAMPSSSPFLTRISCQNSPTHDHGTGIAIDTADPTHVSFLDTAERYPNPWNYPSATQTMSLHSDTRLGPCNLILMTVAAVLAACAPAVDSVDPPAQEAAEPARATLPGGEPLPASHISVGELAGRGEFYAAGGEGAIRAHDGSHYHGYDGPLVWATEGTGVGTQGLLYGVTDGSVVSAGYLIPQEDLAAGRSFHGMTLREVDLPLARSMTVDLILGDTPGTGRYLFLWHFSPTQESTEPAAPAVGDLPPLASLGDRYTVIACDHVPDTRFCPGMGRHYTDLSTRRYRHGRSDLRGSGR
jgi:hypothetical protein